MDDLQYGCFGVSWAPEKGGGSGWCCYAWVGRWFSCFWVNNFNKIAINEKRSKKNISKSIAPPELGYIDGSHQRSLRNHWNRHSPPPQKHVQMRPMHRWHLQSPERSGFSKDQVNSFGRGQVYEEDPRWTDDIRSQKFKTLPSWHLLPLRRWPWNLPDK